MAAITRIIPIALVIFFSWVGICFGEDLTVTVMDVGQADSILIQTAGKTVLIDAGEEKDLAQNKLKKRNISNIDLAVATHPHADHIGGMQSILENINVKVYMDNGFPHTSKMYEKLMEVAESRVTSGNMRYMSARQGMRLNLGKEAHFEVLWPNDTGLSDTRSDINANSVVLKLVHGDVCFLFMGDAEAETEQMVAQQMETCQILKVSHHGSPHSSIPELLDTIQPETALISCGMANKHGHPGKNTLESFAQRNTQVYRTDWQGDITVVSNGRSYTVSTEKDMKLADLPCIDINNAPASEFSSLKGVGKTTIDKVMAARSSHGKYNSVEEFFADLPKDAGHRLEKLSDYFAVDCSNRSAGASKPSAPNPAPVQQAAAQAAVAAPSANPAAAGVININTASEAELQKLPGLNAPKAAAAIEYRNANGPFASCQDLKKVKGIGAKTVAKLLDSCTTGNVAAAPQNTAHQAVAAPQYAANDTPSGMININIASVEQLSAMPGMDMKKASAAMEYRNTNGSFASCKDLQKVKGIGVKTVEKLLSVCTVK